MKTKQGFNLRNICGEYIIVAEGESNIDFSNIISMNESSAFLWKNIQGKEFTCEDLVKLLTDEYEVDETTASKDVTALVETLNRKFLIEITIKPKSDYAFGLYFMNFYF